MPEGAPSTETPWIEPLPDSLLENVSDTSPGPAARYELRETIRLAFIAATQRLPARQRAVLLLRDVVGWSASETAKALNMSLASVTSALQRARDTLSRNISPEEIKRSSETSDHAIGDEYAKAWERADLNGFISLLAKDASLVMPPRNEWYSGRAAIRAFFGWAFDWIWNAGKRDAFRMIATRANDQMALATYVRHRGKTRKFHAHAIQVLTLRRGKITRLTVFVGSQYFKHFGLAAEFAAA
jgi:RNA polymerase sigma-70 factor (ECF subfamily)